MRESSLLRARLGLVSLGIERKPRTRLGGGDRRDGSDGQRRQPRHHRPAASTTTPVLLCNHSHRPWRDTLLSTLFLHPLIFGPSSAQQTIFLLNHCTVSSLARLSCLNANRNPAVALHLVAPGTARSHHLTLKQQTSEHAGANDFHRHRKPPPPLFNHCTSSDIVQLLMTNNQHNEQRT